MEALGMAAVILASGLAFAAVIWAIGSTGRGSGGKQPPNPPPRAQTIKEPPMWIFKTKTVTKVPDDDDKS